ncbi:LysR family transcriptional regulator [Porticoccaceae bacterium]|jgi:DNA-binding transcriptional LysR family regulator|nr:LysR family transcriptional regulator [Porticoccaceae bacterium]MDC0134208.1 LysR family transcriptional regulator [Porticoccaceae bacterium]MDC1477009.1 LysR family transcriptional regulator [Porticoccaceae bacterium]CAI8270504.1 MAG: HTH-type transcriptional activator CmpR [SAR92 bacterium MED-G29]|tara:strand:- start:11025 stop:11894 length:870 start_codon:yes stop_codon:yes gene_type:complete
MDNQNLKAFITVANSGSFSESAEQLHLTQSAISKRIAQLEHQIGKKLFDRIARQVTLTEAGTELLPRALRILQEYENALQAINDLSGEASGTLRLAISHHLGLHRLPPVLKQFAQQYPKVTLDIEFMDSEKAYEQVLHGQSEVAIITLALESHHNIHSQKIWNDPLRFICAQDHPLATLTKPELKDLAEYPIILPGLNTYTGRIIQNLFQQEGIPLKAPMSTNYLETISTMVEIGLGWSVLPETLVRELHVMPFEQVSIARELGYIHHMKRSLSNAAVAFLGMMDAVDH